MPFQDNEEWTLRQNKCHVYEGGSFEHSRLGGKPNQVHVNEVGEVDVASEGKNARERLSKI